MTTRKEERWWTEAGSLLKEARRRKSGHAAEPKPVQPLVSERRLSREELVAEVVEAVTALVSDIIADAIGATGCNGSQREPLPDELLRLDEAAKLLSVSRQFFYARQRELPFVFKLPGGPLRVSRRGLEEWLKQQNGGGR